MSTILAQGRAEAFSDGMFFIALTLLVLETVRRSGPTRFCSAQDNA